MLAAGDEVLRTQHGNNNPWCQDNEVGWFDWSLAGENPGMLRFVTEMIALRRRHPSLRRNRFLTGARGTGRSGQPDIVWYGETLEEPDWADSSSRLLRFTLSGQGPGEGDLHVMLNFSNVSRTPEAPPVPNHRWHRAVATSMESPDDIVPPAQQGPGVRNAWSVPARSIVVLESR